MIKLFGIADTTFTSNGDKVIIPLKAKVHKEDNGAYYLDLETSLDYVNDLTEGRIIVAPTPQGEQAFRVGNVEKTRVKVTTRCYHVFYDTENYLILDANIVDKNCNDALDQLNTATEPESPFTTLSDVQVVDSYQLSQTSYYDGIQAVLATWGGHLVRDNFSIQIRTNIGQDNGVTVRYAKNLKSITCTENWDDVVTQLLPVGQDGIMIDPNDPYVYAPTQYEIPYTKTVTFSQDIDQEPYTDEEGNLDEDSYNAALRADLLAQATEYVNNNYLPKLNYTLTADLEKITDVGDTIQVIDERLGVNIQTSVIMYEYDLILKKYTQVEFGDQKQTLSNLVSNITSSTTSTVTDAVTNMQVVLSEGLQAAQNQIWEALGSSYVVFEGDKILVLDQLPMESAQNVIMINAGGIAFSQTGINGNFQSAWTIDNVLNMEQINVINLTADLLKGGTLKLGSNLNQYGQLEIYDQTNHLIGQMNATEGLKMYGNDGSYVLVNNQVGFAGYDRLGNQIFWANQDEFHMKKSVVEEEITLCNKMRFIPITITDSNNNVTSDGIGLVNVAGTAITREVN